MVEIQQTPPFKFQFPYSHFSTSSLPLEKTMLLRLPSPPLSSSFLSTTTPKHLRLFSSSSSPRPRPRRRRSHFRCAAGNDVVEVDAFTNKSGYLFELSDSDANSIENYDISKIRSIYRRRPLILLRRLFQTGLTFGKWFAFRYIDNLMERSDQMFEVNLYFCSVLKWNCETFGDLLIFNSMQWLINTFACRSELQSFGKYCCNLDRCVMLASLFLCISLLNCLHLLIIWIFVLWLS